MNIIYSDHANEGLIDRKISEWMIEETLFSPDSVVDSKKGRKIAQKIYGNKLLRVVYKKSANAYIVVTVYYSEPRRYVK
jgi:hypothetical protein